MLFRKKEESKIDELSQRLLDEIEIIKREVMDEESQLPKTELMEKVEGLQIEISKWGKSQLKANTVAKADRDILKKQIQELLGKLQPQQSEPEGKLDVGIIKDLLPIADGLEAGIRAGQKLHLANPSAEIGHTNSWLEGMGIVHNRVLELLNKWNVRQMNIVGETFDPHSHIAVGVEHTSEVPENTIVEEQQKGYLLGNEVIRYAEVIVAKEGQSISDAEPQPETTSQAELGLERSIGAESEVEPIPISEKVETPFVAPVKEEFELESPQAEDKSAQAPIRPRRRRRWKDDFKDLCCSIIILAIDSWRKDSNGVSEDEDL